MQRCVSADDVERAVDRAFELQRKTLAGEQPESCQSFRVEMEALKAADLSLTGGAVDGRE